MAKPRKGRVVDAAYREWILTQPSIVVAHDPLCKWSSDHSPLFLGCPVTGHHVRAFGSPKNDYRMVPLWRCRHQLAWGRETVEHGKAAFEKRFGINLEDEIRRLNKLWEERNQ